MDFLKNLFGERDLTQDIASYNQALAEARQGATQTNTGMNPELYKEVLNRATTDAAQRDMLKKHLESTLKY